MFCGLYCLPCDDSDEVFSVMFCVFQVKCFPYYPAGAEHGGQDEMTFEDVGLKVTFVSNLECNNQYTARLLRIEELEVRDYVHCLF